MRSLSFCAASRRLVLIWLLVYLGGAAPVAAQPVTLAGFAFGGQHGSVAQRFPYSAALDARLRAGQASLSRRVIERTRAGPHTLEYADAGALARVKGSDQTVMAVLVLTGETVSTEQIGNYYKTFINLRGDALLFDFKAKRVLRSYPVSVALFDAGAAPPSPAQLAAQVEQMMLRDDEGGLITQYVARMAQARLPGALSRTLQVGRAQIHPDALAALAPALRADARLAERTVADAFGAIMAARLGVAMMPSGADGAQGAMALRLEDGDAIDLAVPAGDYQFELQIDKFAKLKSGESPVGRSYVYGAYGKVRLHEPLSGVEYFAAPLKNGEVKLVPADQRHEDDAPAYEAALRGLFGKLADVFGGGKPDWLEKAGGAPATAQVGAVRALLKSCY